MTRVGPISQLGHWLKMNATAARRPCCWRVQDFRGGSLGCDLFGESERVSKARRAHSFVVGSNDSFDEELVDRLLEGPEVTNSSFGLR